MCYMVHQPIYNKIAKYVPNFVLHEGLPTKEYLESFLEQVTGHTLLVLDDLGVYTTHCKPVFGWNAPERFHIGNNAPAAVL